MLIDVMYSLLSILEDNQSAPMVDAIHWERQLADDCDDATLRDVYADKLAEWGCRKREADVRREAERIRRGESIPPRRHLPPAVMRYPAGTIEIDGTSRTGQDIAHEALSRWQSSGGVLTLPNTRDYSGNLMWDVEFAPGSPTILPKPEGDSE